MIGGWYRGKKFSMIEHEAPKMKNLKYLIYFICLSGILGANLYFRTYPSTFSHLKKAAEFQVQDSIKKVAEDLVDKKWSGYSQTVRRLQVENIEREIRKSDRYTALVKEKLKEIADTYKDSSGSTYLSELDTYQWFRYTKNIVDHGYPGDIKKDGISWDTLMTAPHGCRVTPHHFLFYSTAWLYKLYCFFLPDISIQNFCYFIPLFHISILLLLLFFFCARFFSIETGLVATILFGFSELVMRNSMAGWYDYDTLNCIFPIAIIWLITEALQKKNIRGIVVFSAFAALLLGLFASHWVGWVFIFALVLGTLTVSLANTINLRFKDKKRLWKESLPYGIVMITFFLGGIIFCFLIARINLFAYLQHSVKIALGLGTSLHQTIFPQTYYTVSELKPGDFDKIAAQLHGTLLFIGAVFSMVWVYWKNKRNDKADICLILIFWFVAMSYATMNAVRFTFFLSVPCTVFLSVAMVDIITKIHSLCVRSTVKYVRFGAIAAVILLAIPVYRDVVDVGQKVAKGTRPMMNDAWHREMEVIRDSIPSNGIILSWWDYGSWIKQIGKHKVFIDGHSQERPATQWIARFLMSTNEDEALTIVRMLAHSSDKLFDTLSAHFNDPYMAISLLNRLIMSKKEDAEKIIRNYKIPDSLNASLLTSLYGTPCDPVYVLVYEKMIDITTAFSFLGNWEFPRVYYMKNIGIPKDQLVTSAVNLFSLTRSDAVRLYTDVASVSEKKDKDEIMSSRDGYGTRLRGFQDGNQVFFREGFFCDLSKKEAKILKSSGKGFQRPSYLYVYDKDSLFINTWGSDSATLSEKKAYCEESDIIPFGYLVSKMDRDSSWEMISFSSLKLAQSIFTKLMFLDGFGLSHFELVHRSEDRSMLIYRVNWSPEKDTRINEVKL
jgi:dolichyl-diphosphooligosaccharide--protein glycosyltransferase